jgi:hypothetical protein
VVDHQPSSVSRLRSSIALAGLLLLYYYYYHCLSPVSARIQVDFPWHGRCDQLPMADSYALSDRRSRVEAGPAKPKRTRLRFCRLLNFAQIAGVLGGFDLNWPSEYRLAWPHESDCARQDVDRVMVGQVV